MHSSVSWGDFPYHQASQIGGVASLRGWDQQRFAGRSSAFGSAELRLQLANVRVIVPADFGLHGFSDIARGFADGEQSDAWHTGVGGGRWIAPLARTHTVSLSLRRGVNATRSIHRVALRSDVECVQQLLAIVGVFA